MLEYRVLLVVLLPVVSGILLLSGRFFTKQRNRKLWFIGLVLAVNGLFVLRILIEPDQSFVLWRLTDVITIGFCVDGVSRLFAALTSVVWLLAGVYSFEYMKHEKNEDRFFGFYLIVLGVLLGLDFSANLVTFYFFFEMMTLTSLPLVLHQLTKEAVMAGLKYLFYSVAGAFMALFGIFFMANYTVSLDFTAGGTLDLVKVAGHEGLLFASVFLMVIGFGTKAGMFPMHGWLPTAHPVAPAPASAVLSGLITKSGILALVRVIYYITGTDLIRGTWVQMVWLLLSLLTVFMGSMLAYKEPIMKKRLAYSTVSQVSYISFGLALFHPAGFVGALAHLVFHSLIKNTLFFAAGAVIYRTGKTRIEEWLGIGKKMPVTIWCFTLVSLALIGIPPASGFISKWFLATGALAAEVGAYSWMGPVVLLVSALLTAGYLLPVTIHGFFPGVDYDYKDVGREDPSCLMLIPMLFLTACAVLFGIWPTPLLQMLQAIAGQVL